MEEDMSGTITAESIKKTITYFYLLSYSPPADIEMFKEHVYPWKKQISKSASVSETKFFKEVIPEVCHRIVSYHEDTGEPNQDWVDALIKTAGKADKSSEDLYEFQEMMSNIARLPQRALPENRLHRKKGCALCQLPCHYGFFTLVSDPDFDTLQDMLEAEVNRSGDTQSAIRPVWNFTFSHLMRSFDFKEEYTLHRRHLGNLSYCLLMLAMAKSRLALPEKQLKVYQAINQRLIQPNNSANRN
jgi:hypothetical protein